MGDYLMGRGWKDIMSNGDSTRLEKGNQIRGVGLCFQPGAQNPSSDSGARLPKVGYTEAIF
jgi:hypothetical protein